MARVLIVGCAGRGRALGRALIEDGWAVRGTSRRPEEREAMEADGIEPAEADPNLIGSVLDQIDGVSVIAWLLGAPQGGEEAALTLNGGRLERLAEEIVDTPVRGVAFESTGPGGAEASRVLTQAAERWRIASAPIEADPADREGWLAAARAAVPAALG